MTLTGCFFGRTVHLMPPLTSCEVSGHRLYISISRLLLQAAGHFLLLDEMRADLWLGRSNEELGLP